MQCWGSRMTALRPHLGHSKVARLPPKPAVPTYVRRRHLRYSRSNGNFAAALEQYQLSNSIAMSQARDNHYVPQWYQRQFSRAGRGTLAYLDLEPETRQLPDGRVIAQRALHTAPTKRCFFQTDLYSTFFGTIVNDEIERRLFGAIDNRGSQAVRAYQTSDQSAWHHHFRDLFEFLDIQKIRTPKGLAWLRAQYPRMSQNELMQEMQGIRFLHCTIWTEGVREIVSAEDADVKFIVTDNPVTVYNSAVPPADVPQSKFLDPSIALKGSQTIFPLSPDFCLILTNLEYAKDPASAPLEKRTFARNFRQSMVNTINFIRSRKLSGDEVTRVNAILKASARRYVAAGLEEWLYPELSVVEPWPRLGEVLLPPEDGLWHFGGEMYAGFDDGRVHYQDAFGRTEKPREVLLKPPRESDPKPDEPCGCGSIYPFARCCKSRSPELRPSWTELSIRERNLTLFRGVVNILGLNQPKDWAAVRRDLTEKQISDVYYLYEALWPRETDLLKLLPKPDGRSRAVYTGSLHPELFVEFALGAGLYFGEMIVEHPFVHNGAVRKEFSPVDRPAQYHLEFLKAVGFFLNVMPLVELGVINLIPDICTFDLHLRDQMMHMANERSAGLRFDKGDEPRFEALIEREQRRTIMMQPRDSLEASVREHLETKENVSSAEVLADIERMKEADPLIALTDTIWGGPDGGQLQLMKIAPNFEIAMYLAQATGAAIVTDSVFRWKELQRALRPRFGDPVTHLKDFAGAISAEPFLFPHDSLDVVKCVWEGGFSEYPKIMGEVVRYASRIAKRGTKPNW